MSAMANACPNETSPPGSIRLVSGCMFSGKTTVLIREVQAARNRGLAAVVFKHEVDNRCDVERVSTHNHNSTDALPVRSSREIPSAANGADLVAIDEAHFFDDDLPEVCRALRERGQEVVVTALDRTWKGHEFPVVRLLGEIADHRERLLAVCARCGRPATHSQRMVPFETPGDFVGGAESYEPRCPECFVPGVAPAE